MDIRSVGICLKENQLQAGRTVAEAVAWLLDRGLQVLCDSSCKALPELSEDTVRGILFVDRAELARRADLIVALGGDGTLLSVARAAGTRSVPILGVNLGRLGFLTEINIDELFPALDKMLSGDLQVVSRNRLEVVARRGERELGRYHALNDAVITKTTISRMIDLEAFADGVKVTTYHADGLIVSTPTGSTAYSLSAGGPLLVPGIEAIVMTPICPHSLTQRPLVLPQSAEIEIVVKVPGGDVALTVDGQDGIELDDGDRVTVHRSAYPVGIVSSPFRNRYEILHEKLHWGER
jgi:NAD+ kinase